MKSAKSQQIAFWIESILWVVGLVLLFALVLTWGHSFEAQHQGEEELSELLLNPGVSSSTSIAPGAVFGRVEVPRLGLSAVIFEGTDNETLAKGVGHLITSAEGTTGGNLVLAGHRDTFFRPLRNLHTGDILLLTTHQGIQEYKVQATEVVNPNATRVLAPTVHPTLTLITCYPFSFLGSAPQRFIAYATPVI